MNTRKIIICLSCLIFVLPFGYSQTTINLDEMLRLVKQKSIEVRSAQRQLKLVEAENTFFKSQLRPQLGLSAQIPNYNKTSSPVIQPDGTIAFQSIRQGSSALSLTASQVIAKTGGQLFLTSDLQRFDDFSTNFKTYNGIPLRIGFSQNLFAYNPWGAEKKLQPLHVQEARKNFNAQLEASLLAGTELYFNILIAQQNLEIAQTNEKVNQELITITKERLELGKVSQDEMLQLEIQLFNAQLAAAQTKNILSEAKSQLATFLGDPTLVYDIYQEPELKPETYIDNEALHKNAGQNRPEIIAYQKALLNAENEIAQAKNDFGFQARVNASLGLARGSTELSEVYQDPFNEQQFNLSLNVPILDWGRKKTAISIAKIRGDAAIDNQAQLLITLTNDINQAAARFNRIQANLTLLRSIMEKSALRFKISNERYVLGDINITNLTIAQNEKDSNKRNYINALRSYWLAYSQLRLLTGYDIFSKQNITHS